MFSRTSESNFSNQFFQCTAFCNRWGQSGVANDFPREEFVGQKGGLGPQVDPQKKHDIVSGWWQLKMYVGKKIHPESWGRFPPILKNLFFSRWVGSTTN